MPKTKDCRLRADELLKQAVKEKRSIMRETLEALAEEVEKYKKKHHKLVIEKV